MANALPGGGGGGPVTSQVAAQRYAAMRLHQAVQAGLIPATVLNAHPNSYPEIWRMVSQHISQPAHQAGYSDPGYWLRIGAPKFNPRPTTVPDAPVTSPQIQGVQGAGIGPGAGAVPHEPVAPGALAPFTPFPQQALDPQLLALMQQLFPQLAQGISQPMTPANTIGHGPSIT